MSEPTRIETLSDLIEAAKATDDVDGLFTDLRIWVDLGIELEGNGMLGGDSPIRWNPTFLWKDDCERGLSGVRFNIEKDQP